MSRTLKNYLVIVLSVITLFVMGFGVWGMSTKAMADTSSSTSFKMLEGASIRNVAPMGMRFTAQISGTEYKTVSDQGGKFGMIIAPSDFINSDDTFNMEDMSEYVAGSSTPGYLKSETITAVPDLNDFDKDGITSEYNINCSFVGIKESNFSREFSARVFYQIGTETPVYTENVAKRAVYTVASYSSNIGEFANDADITEYLNGIIEKVETSYTNKEIILEGVTDNKTEIGSTFNIKAVVSRGEGESKQTLESGALVSIKDKEDNATDIVSINSDGSYTVNYLGDFKVVATSGENSQEFTIDNQDTLNIFSTHDDIKGINNTNNDSNIKNYTGESNMQWTMMSSYVGHDNVLIWEQKTDSEITADNEHYGFTFAEDIRKQMRTDVYLYMDIYYVGTSSSTWFTVHGRTADERTYFSTGITGKLSDIRAFYTADGTRLSPSDNYSGIGPAQGGGTGEWLTLEYKLPSQWADDDYFSAYNSYNARSYRGKMYFANIRLSTEKIENPEIEIKVEEEIKPMFETPFSVSSTQYGTVTLETVGDFAGRYDVQKYSCTNATGVTRYNGISLTSEVRSALGTGKYLYLDLYREASYGMQIHINNNSSDYVYNFSNTASWTSDVADVRVLDGSTGTYTPSSIGENKWFTLEFYLKQDTYKRIVLYPTNSSAKYLYFDPTSVRVYDTQQTVAYVQPEQPEPPTVLEDPKAVDGQVLTNEQAAVVEVAKAYYRQRDAINYDQYNSRRNLIISPEEANLQRTVYLDCSSFVNNCYMEAFGAPIIPASYNLSVNTSSFAKYALENPANADVVGHWVNADYTTPEAQAEILSSVRSKLQVGDILNYRHTSGDGAGHVYIYMGNDQFLHCHSGNSYLMDTDNPSEAHDRGSSFAIINYISADSLFTDTTNNRYLFKDTANDRVENFSLLRPLARTDEMVITEETQGRMTIAGVTLDKTSSVGYNSAVCKGDEITYTITLKNNFAVSKSATLNDTLPEGVEFVSSDTVTCTDGVISWTGSVSGLGTTTLEYTVKVLDTATAGTLIVSNKTTINGVYLSTITHTVSGYTATELESVATAAKSVTEGSASNPLDIVKSIYAGLDSDFLNDYDTVQDLLNALIDSTNNTKTDATVSNMIAPNLFGGYSIRTGLMEDYQRTRLVTESNLAVGDIIVADWTDSSSNSNSLVYVYVGDSTLISITSIGGVIEVETLTIGDDIWNAASDSDSPNYLVSLISYNRFAVLRPSMYVTSAAA